MNAPLHLAAQPAPVRPSLDDKYRLERGVAFMSGVQALVRLPMLQQQRDAAAGHLTAGFISGYRGSPLGGYDQALWQAAPYLEAHQLVFQPGVNEELAATAVWGTQQLGYAPPGSHKYEGVFGLWYGKGPGADRCADVFKHANMAGTTPLGGVIAVVGDDHVAKSSTAAHQSDHLFRACSLPVFFPTSVQEILDLGIHAWAMSRYTGLWSGLKTIQEVVESSAPVQIDPERVSVVLPDDFVMPPGGLHIRWPDTPLEQEARLMHYKCYAALAYVRANRLNHNVIAGPRDRFGLMASGKAYNDTRQALADLGLDEAACNALGIRLHKVAVVWPLDAQITRSFATGLQEILVVEEKRQIIEYQLKEELYNWRADVRPNVVGKFEQQPGDFSGGEWSLANPAENELLRANADLDPERIARALVRRLRATGTLAAAPADLRTRIEARIAELEARQQALGVLAGGHAVTGAARPPWYCSGCPHNTSTVVPEGSRAMAGIGCHYMVTWMDRRTLGFTQMGGEGVPWVGQQPFSHEQHVFANLGDGTYFHSGLLAIRQAIAAGVNITYKILYNDAVAMTGGQPVGERPEGHSVAQIVGSLQAEGVARVVIVTDEPEKYAGVFLPGAPRVEHREQMDAVQRELRAVPGTTVLIYDQTCATEKRRRRKRGTLADPPVRVFIHETVCEGCGDCGVQSNCLSVEPLETEFGRKRQINQSSCNKDLRCLDGFCPSFVTVTGSRLRVPEPVQAGEPTDLGELPSPTLPVLQGRAEPWGVVVAGVGGTGVITLGQILGVAAHLEGKGVITQDAAGLAQKGGATWSHVQIAETQEAVRTTRVGAASADVLLACDPVVAVNPESMTRLAPGRSHVVLNSHGAPTAEFVKNANWQNPEAACAVQLAQAVGEAYLGRFDAEAAARALLGDTLFANVMLLGYAWQRGWLPIGLAAIERAFTLNAQAVESNLRAFAWGRQAAARPAAMRAHVAQRLGQRTARPDGAQVITFKPRETVDALVARRMAYLSDYQDAAYAERYQRFVAKVRAAEQPLGRSALGVAVAHGLFKLMAYKDEYEVARLLSDPAFRQRIAEQMAGEEGQDWQLHYHLSSPFSRQQDARGRPLKRRYGPAMRLAFRVMARFKGLRGGSLDVFGRSAERREERALIDEYRACIEQLLLTLDADNHALAVEIARLPEGIRGFGPVKAKNLAATRERWAALMAEWEQPATTRRATG